MTAPRAVTAASPASEVTDAGASGTDSLATADRPGLDGRPIRSITLRPLNIFDATSGGGLRPFYSTANHLHVVTRRSTLNAQLLFRTGEPWSRALAQETERNLRALDFLLPERIQARPAGEAGDSVDVVVVTHDTWTTSPELNLASGGGQQVGSFALTERNFLGLGTSLSLSYRQDQNGVSRFISVNDNDMFGTHTRAGFISGSGSVGLVQGASLALPFYAEDTPRAAGLSGSRQDNTARLYQRGIEVAHFDRHEESFETYFGVGSRVEGSVQRVVGKFEALDRRFGPSTLEPGAPPEFAGDEENLRIRRFTGEVRWWTPRYVERQGIEQFEHIEDYDLGTSTTFALGYAPRALGSSADEGYVRFQVDTGAEVPRFGFGFARARLSSRLRTHAVEALSEVRARWIQQPSPGQSVVLAAVGVAGYQMQRDFQVLFGGLNGLRAYPVQALAGDQGWRLNLEHRWLAVSDVWNVLSFGAAEFVDAACTWGPGSAQAGWYQDAGLGLRLSFLHSAVNQIARFDIAWPLNPTRDGKRQPVFSFGSSQAF